MRFQARAPASGTTRLAGYRPIVEVAKSYVGSLTVAVGERGEHEGDVVLVRGVGLGDLDPTTRKTLVEGARRGLTARHDNIVSCLEVADEEALLGVVSAYQDGAPLGMLARMATTRREPTPPGVALRIALDVLDALAFLDTQPGYVPGGLAPEALHIGADGRTRLLEPHLHGPLGQHPIAAEHHDRVAYEAPESLEGVSPTHASDRFSVAVILWELLQKRRLFAGLGVAAIRDKILAVGDTPPDVSTLPEPLAGVLLKGLAREPEERFESAEAMRAALQDAAEVAPHADVAALFEAVLGAHPSIQRIRKAVRENAGERTEATRAPREDKRARADKITTKPAIPAAREGGPRTSKSTRLGSGLGGSAPPRPPKPKRSALGFASRRPPPQPSAREGKPDEAAEPASPSDPGQSMLPVEGVASDPIPVSMLPLSSAPPASDDPARHRATVPAGPKREAEEIDVPKAPAAPEVVEDPPSSERPRTESVAPADSLPPPGDDEVDQLTQAGPARQVGRCELFVEIAHGGMATVHLGRWLGAGGFVKTVAVKALHRQYARDPEFVRMFLDEARVVARIRHPNVMPIIDLVDDGGDLFIVMEYVHGVTLAHLLRQMQRRNEKIPIGIALRIMSGVLHGLHAAHEAKDATGQPMNIIHRDISPENIMVGADGYARLIDFGIASALGRATVTQDGQVKGKPSYLAPEQVMGETLDRRTDIYAASVVLWQALTGRRLFKAENMAAMSLKIIKGNCPPPSKLRDGITRELDAIVLRGMAGPPKDRFEDAELMAEAIEKAASLSSHREVGQWVKAVASSRLERSQTVLEAVEAAPVTEIGDDDELGPMSVRQAPRPPIAAAEGLTGANDISFTDITSEASTTGTLSQTSPKQRGLVIAGAVVAAAAFAVILSFALGRGTAPGPAGTPATDASHAPTRPTSEPTASPSVAASAATDELGEGGTDVEGRGGGSSSPAPTGSASATPSSSASAGPATPVPGPLPKWPQPPPNPRLPTGI